MTDLTRTTTRLSSDMDKKKGIIGGSETPVVTDKKVTTTPPTTSIGATAPSQSEDEYNENPQTPPQTMPAQPQPTQVAPTPPSLAAQPQGEEYNETPQAPPTTPAPAVTTTSPIQTPQYNDTDRRNQANLAAQTTTAPTDNETMILQFDKDHNPTLVKTDVATPKITPKTTDTAPSTTTPATEGEEFRSYRDILAKYAPLTSDEEKKKQMRREKRNAIIGALGDGLSALSNLYFTTKGAPDQGLKPGMTDAAKKRMDDLRTQWQKEKDKYQDLMLKGLEMDREQGNWLKSYELQKNEEERKQKTFEKELPLLEKKVQAAEEELKKLIRENNINDATWQQSVEVAKEELAWKKYELEFMKTHKGYSPKEWEEHLATERYRSRTLANNSGKGGGGKGADDTYYIADIVNGKSFNASKDQVIKTYRWLQSRNFVSGKAKTPADMVSEIQSYYTGGPGGNLLGGGKKHYGRVDDKKGGSKTDALLGGSSSGITGLYDNF